MSTNIRHHTAAEAARRKRERADGDRPAPHNGIAPPKPVTLPRVSIIATKPGEPSPGGSRWRMA